MKTLFALALALFLFSPLTAPRAQAINLNDIFLKAFDQSAQSLKPSNLPGVAVYGEGGGEARVARLVQYAINLVLYASGSVAVLMFIYGGIRMIFSFADAEGMEAAKKILKMSSIGLLVVILGYALVTNVISLIYRAAT